ncbi:MAG: hypothetical protein ACKO5F_15405 [Synechococcus sp.]
MASRQHVGGRGQRGPLVCADCGRPLPSPGAGESRPISWRDGLLLALITALAGVSLSLIWLVDRFEQPELTAPGAVEAPEQPEE